MATGAPFTLIDSARRTDPDGESSDIAEILSQANDIYDHLTWKEGNTNTGHVFTVRSSIPGGVWRYIGMGVPTSKSTSMQGRINCGMLEDQITLDRKILEMAQDQNKFRYEEDNAHIEGLSQTLAGQFIYGNALQNPASFTGLSPWYASVNPATSDSAPNVFDGGGVGSNNTSLWLVGWSPRSIYGVFPKGSKAGLMVEPLDTTQLAYDNLGNPYRAAVTWFRQEAGLCVEDWRWGTRLCNLDVTAAGLGGPTPFDIFATLSKMVKRLPKAGRKISGITKTDAPSEQGLVVHPMIMVNRTLGGIMDIQAIRDKNVLITPENPAGYPTETYRGIPIGTMDQISSSETRVV